VGLLFAVCTVLLIVYPLGRDRTIRMAGELEGRRRAALAAPAA
jgi:hypothetical protein